MTSLTNLPYDLYLNISSYLNKRDIKGFIQCCKKTSSLLLWCNDDAGVHICLGCDLTYSMDGAYQNLKRYLLELLTDLKNNKSNHRTLFSSFFYWDLDRSSYEDEPYIQIQPPAESIIKQIQLISDATIASGGGPECGGIALCELDTQFRNRWISQYTGNFGKSMDIIVLCLDAPFHFLVDTDSYYEVTRKHSIKYDWLAAIHSLCNKGVLIIMIIINTQPNFKKPLRLLGGMIDALGGFAIEVDIQSLNNIPIFIKTIIKEEAQKRKIVHDIYKSIAYKYKNMSEVQLQKVMEEKLNQININVDCINIPSKNRIYSRDVSNSRELANCKTMKEAINKGLLESEAVMKRLCYNSNMPAGVACETNKQNFNSFSQSLKHNIHDNDIIPLQPLMLCRQQSICVTIPKQLITSTKSDLKTQRILPIKPSDSSNNSVNDTSLIRSTLDKISSGYKLNSFGLRRQKSISRDYLPNPINGRSSNIINLSLSTIREDRECCNKDNTSCIIEGSIKCYLREPNINLGYITDPLLSLVDKSGDNNELKFRKLLLQQNPKQYELYLNGGVLNRFNNTIDTKIVDVPVKNDEDEYGEDGLISEIKPTMTRAFSESRDSNNRILKFIRSNSIQ